VEGAPLRAPACLEPALRGARGELAGALKARALEEGFALVGITMPAASSQMEFYREWLAEGRHGQMAYLARSDAVRRRGDLTDTLPEVRSCVVVAHEYGSGDDAKGPTDPARAVIARYARGDDYHDVVLSKLQRLLEWLDHTVEGGVSGRAYVDTGPILERELGRRAGLGWFGRNTMLIHPERGSYFFLGVLLLDLELPPDPPFEEDRCGTCRACLDACPTRALLGRDANGAPVIDARLCISYLTIELRGPIPAELRHAIGNRVFGCDICQEVCPWHERFGRPAAEPAYRAREGLSGPALVDLATRLLGLDESLFREHFRGSPLLRAKRDGLLRNVCVALGNWGTVEALPPLLRALVDPSSLVRSHAAWALGRIGSPRASRDLDTRLGIEADEAVRHELSLVLEICKPIDGSSQDGL